MPKLELTLSTDIQRTPRVLQLEGMFDVPASEKLTRNWSVDIPIEPDTWPGDEPWQIGLIVGPSGGGKTQIARRCFGSAVDRPLNWNNAGAVIDDFDQQIPMTEITGACSAVGFNTVPSWLKPFPVLSNGEQFRVSLARRLCEGVPVEAQGGVDLPTDTVDENGLVVVDEFTSVVDRKVAKIGAHAVQKFVRRRPGMKFVAVTCHYDVADWLRPDWIYDPSIEDPTRRFAWGSVQPRRPDIECVISPVDYAAWHRFAPYHYLTRDLVKSARCWGLWVDGELASFCACLYRPNAQRKPVIGFSRTVTLPDYQGIGLAYTLNRVIASCYKGLGYKVNSYPTHPALTRTRDRSTDWALVKKPGEFRACQSLEQLAQKYSRTQLSKTGSHRHWMRTAGSRPNAIFTYVGDSMDVAEAARLISIWPTVKIPKRNNISVGEFLRNKPN